MTVSAVLVPVAVGLGGFLLLHVMLWRAAPSNSPRLFRLVSLAAAGLFLSTAVGLSQSGLNGLELWPILWFDVFGVVAYVFFYAGLARSVSATLLGRVLEAGRLRFDDLAGEYAESSRFEDRIQLMHEAGLVQISGATVSLTWRGSHLARACQLAARLTASRLEG